MVAIFFCFGILNTISAQFQQTLVFFAMTFLERWYNEFMKKWYIEVFNIFTKKRKRGVVTGDLDRIKAGLAQAGWDTKLAMPAEKMTHGC